MQLERGFAAHDSASAFDNPEPAYSLNAQVQHWHPPVVLFVFVLCTSRAIRFEVIFVSVGSLKNYLKPDGTTRAEDEDEKDDWRMPMLDLGIERIGGLGIVECRGRIVRSEAAFKLRRAVTSLESSRIIVLD